MIQYWWRIKRVMDYKNMDEWWMMINDVTTCRIIYIRIWVVNGRNVQNNHKTSKNKKDHKRWTKLSKISGEKKKNIWIPRNYWLLFPSSKMFEKSWREFPEFIFIMVLEWSRSISRNFGWTNNLKIFFLISFFTIKGI